MPNKRQPKTLYQHCIEMSIYAILMEWRDRHDGQFSVLFTKILPMFPPSVLNSLVSDVVDVFVQTENSHCDGGKSSLDGSLSILLDSVLSNRITFLDLSPLARLDSINPVEVVRSEKIILRSLSKMSNLVNLSFKASRTTPTVPICGDDLLKAVGYNCPKLKSLDVSYNHTVTDTGLSYLWKEPLNYPLSDVSYVGCPELKKLTIFGCAVTAEGVSKLLEHIESLQIVGFKETGSSLMLLNKRKRDQKLNLVYLNNMGCGMKTIEDLNKLHYSCKMSHVVLRMCPNITELKIRVTDATLEHVVLGPSINSIHLIFDIGRQLAVGRGLLSLVKNYGLQLTTLSLVCSTISTDQMIKIGNCCQNLDTLTVKCGHMNHPDDVLLAGFTKHNCNKNFPNLENLFFTVLSNNEHHGIQFLPYIVHSTKLKNFYLSYSSNLFTNIWVEDFLTFFDTRCLETFIVDVPNHAFSHAALSLTVKSVDLIIAKCPQIKTIGNLFAWCISVEELKDLCRARETENCDLDFIYHPVPVHMNFQNFN